VLDVAMALCWIPFFVTTRLLEGAEHALLDQFIIGVLLLSFSHQPLTLFMVYGDQQQFRLRPMLFSVSPFVFVALTAGLALLNPILLAVAGGLWNAEHTLMQRYGITRIYGRKAGQLEGRRELFMLFSWLALALVWVAADPRTPDKAAAVSLGENNTQAIDVLSRLQPIAAWLVVPAGVLAVTLLVRWIAAERTRVRSGAANPAKWLYVTSTAALFVAILVDPLAGLMGYVGAHALEYFIIVNHSIGRRYRHGGRSPLGRVVGAATGRPGFFLVYFATVAAIVVGLDHLDEPVAYAVVFFTLGGLHVFYDGFIWKLRQPKVADSLDIPSAGIPSAGIAGASVST
jgi:hypothetical protein